jgi:pimeloyl-ACP methyl ester carboxylesterase
MEKHKFLLIYSLLFFMSAGIMAQEKHFANINGIKIYYEIYGKGEPLLLLHGNSQSGEIFDLQIKDFSKKYKVIVMDTRSQGRSSDDPNVRLTYDLFADDTKKLLDELQLDSVNVVGWSDGGITGLILAYKFPRKVKKLCITGANLFPDESSVKKDVLTAIKNAQKQAEKKKDTKQYRLMTLLLEEPKTTFDDLKNINCPTLVMAGERDIIVESHTKQIAASIPNAQLMIFRKQTHYVVQESPGIFDKAVLDFLKK